MYAATIVERWLKVIPIICPEYVRDDYGDDWQEYTFTMPADMEGGDLPALANAKKNQVVSFWQPNDLELEAIMKGHVVALTLIGSQPPVSINVI